MFVFHQNSSCGHKNQGSIKISGKSAAEFDGSGESEEPLEKAVNLVHTTKIVTAIFKFGGEKTC